VIVFKIYNDPTFKEIHNEYFTSLLNTLRQHDLLSSSLDEIVITDDIDGEIERYCLNRFRQPNLTRSREYKALAKTIDFDGKKKVFFDATYVNCFEPYASQIFFDQLIDIKAEDSISLKHKVDRSFTFDTSLEDIVKIHFHGWAAKIEASKIASTLAFPRDKIYDDVRIFVDSFKRNIKKLHYNYQQDLSLEEFWIQTVRETDFFIHRCLDVHFDGGSFSELQEFDVIVPVLLKELEAQHGSLMQGNEVEFELIHNQIRELLLKCSVNVKYEDRMSVKITQSPKNLFKTTLVDTEPRIVAFIDILGFSSIIAEYDSDDESNILNELHETLETAIKVSIENMTDVKVRTEMSEHLEYRMFSDCICLSLPYIEFGNDFHIQFKSIATIATSYQLMMMQKGFFVRGGISMGSFFSDKNMIFSGGLVKAYKLEQIAVYPIIVVDDAIIQRLSSDFQKNAKNLFLERILILSNTRPEVVFLNPFDSLDNSLANFDYIQSSMNGLINENQLDEDDTLSKLSNSLISAMNTLSQPIFDYAKSQMSPETMNAVKEHILEHICDQILRHEKIAQESKKASQEEEVARRIIKKYEHMKTLTDWSLRKDNTSQFTHYRFK